MKFWTSRIPIFLGAIVTSSIGLASLLGLKAQTSCELQSVNTQPIEGTAWIFMMRGYACGFGIGGNADVIARNTDTGEILTIAKGEGLSTSFLYVKGENHVFIKIPNLSDVIVFSRNIPGISISIVYFPEDKPDERKNILYG